VKALICLLLGFVQLVGCLVAGLVDCIFGVLCLVRYGITGLTGAAENAFLGAAQAVTDGAAGAFGALACIIGDVAKAVCVQVSLLAGCITGLASFVAS